MNPWTCSPFLSVSLTVAYTLLAPVAPDTVDIRASGQLCDESLSCSHIATPKTFSFHFSCGTWQQSWLFYPVATLESWILIYFYIWQFPKVDCFHISTKFKVLGYFRHDFFFTTCSAFGWGTFARMWFPVMARLGPIIQELSDQTRH